MNPDRRSILVAMATSFLWPRTGLAEAGPVPIAGAAGSYVRGDVPEHLHLIAKSEPALLDLCAIPLDRGGPQAVVVRGPDDPPDRFELVASGRTRGRAVRVRPVRRGGTIVALSSDLPHLAGFASCPRMAPDHLRHAISAGVLDAAVVSEPAARILEAEGLVDAPEPVAAPALRPPRLMVDSAWRRRCPGEVERLRAATVFALY